MNCLLISREQEEIQFIIDESLYNIVDVEESEEDAYTLV